MSRAVLSDGFEDMILDSVIEETFSFTSEVSNHTIEAGVDITDHVKRIPETVNISAVLSNYTGLSLLGDPFTRGQDLTDRLNPTAKIGLGVGLSFIQAEDTTREKALLLEIWKEDSELLTYTGHADILEDAVISELSFRPALQFGDGLAVDIILQKVRIATATVKLLTIPVSIKSSANNKKGKVEAKKTTSLQSNLNKNFGTIFK